jgi:hypothetical protein
LAFDLGELLPSGLLGAVVLELPGAGVCVGEPDGVGVPPVVAGVLAPLGGVEPGVPDAVGSGPGEVVAGEVVLGEVVLPGVVLPGVVLEPGGVGVGGVDWFGG